MFYGVLRLMGFGEPSIRNRTQVYDVPLRSRTWKGAGVTRGAETQLHAAELPVVLT